MFSLYSFSNINITTSLPKILNASNPIESKASVIKFHIATQAVSVFITKTNIQVINYTVVIFLLYQVHILYIEIFFKTSTAYYSFCVFECQSVYLDVVHWYNSSRTHYIYNSLHSSFFVYTVSDKLYNQFLALYG